MKLFRFFGGGDAPPPATSTTTVQQAYSPAEEKARGLLYDTGADIYQRTKDKIQSGGYPGAKPVGLSPESLMAQNMLRSAATGPGTILAGRAGGALNFGLGDVLYPGSNPALQATIDTATRRVGEAYTDPGGVLSKIRTNSMLGNTEGSGTREGIAEGLAARSYLNTIGDVTGKLSSDAYGQGLDFMKSSMAFAPNMYNLMTQPALSMGAIGAQNEAAAQQQANFEAMKQQWGLTSEWQALQPYASLITGLSNPSTMTTSTSPTGQANPMAPFGMALQGAQMAGMFGVNPLVGGGLGLLAGFL